ncbi:MAG TPA: hypothetical protein VHL80_18950 [Polyangia bacterium]|nr:hypothetical protein [Polyangia bacterium]
MAIFAKKTEGEPLRPVPDLGVPLPHPGGKGVRFGIADAMALLRGLPGEDKNDLVVRVMRATLASVSVHLPEVIEDATRRQKATTERIASVHGQMAELERQLENHRREIAALEADLKETTAVKERLTHAEKAATLAAGPPPPPPPRAAAPALPSPTKTPTPEPITKVTHETFKD